jgi:hypothetical protein
LKHWCSLAPEANIGVSTANLIVLDVDPEHDGLASLRKLESEHGQLPLTWSVVTGSGGLHYYYRRSPGLELDLPIIASQQKVPPFGPGIDVPDLRDHTAVQAHQRPRPPRARLAHSGSPS